MSMMNLAHSVQSVTGLDLAISRIALGNDPQEAERVYLLLADGQEQHPAVQAFWKRVEEIVAHIEKQSQR